MKLAIFFHCLFFMDTPDNLLTNAVWIVTDQMLELERCGLLAATTEFHVGLNGGEESARMATLLIPPKAKIRLHGLQCHNENRTIRMLEEWLPGHEDWLVFYFHAKGSTSPPERQSMSERWRMCMMRHCITNWRTCVSDLDKGCDAVGCHFMEPPATPPGQRIFGGNFWWAKASYLSTLPSILQRDRIRFSGIDSLDSRYESEVWIGNGPQKPRVRDFHPGWNPSKISTCSL